jgi:hypothetical protein
MEDFLNHCFVCGTKIDPITSEKNKLLNLPVCMECSNTDREKNAVQEYLEGMADGFVCGCI